MKQLRSAQRQDGSNLLQHSRLALWRWRRVGLAVLLLLASGSAALAQEVPKLKHLGIMGPISCPGFDRPVRATEHLLPALAKRGWIDGKNLVVDCVAPGDHIEQVPALAAELVARKPDVLFAASTDAIRALKQATTKIPIVTAAPDPLRGGIVTNLAHPDANVTGVAPMSFELLTKRIELLRDLLPRFSRLAVISSFGIDPLDEELMQTDITAAAHAFSLTYELFRPKAVGDIDELFEKLQADGFDAAYIWPSPFSNTYHSWIAASALKHNVPTISEAAEDTRVGILASYGINKAQIQQIAAEYIDKLLRGATPVDLPLQQPTKLEMTINVRVAKALGLTIPQSILLRADEVIE